MKIPVWALIFIIMVGCVAKNEQPTNREIINEMANDAASNLLVSKFRENGANLFCDQESYLRCVNISHKQCLQDLKPYINDCFDTAGMKIGLPINDKNAKEYTEIFAACMVATHVDIHGQRLSSVEELQSIGKCLSESSFDEKQFKKSFMRSENTTKYEKYSATQEKIKKKTKLEYISVKDQTIYLNKHLPSYLGITPNNIQIESTDSGISHVTILKVISEKEKDQLQEKIYDLRLKYPHLRPIRLFFN